MLTKSSDGLKRTEPTRLAKSSWLSLSLSLGLLSCAGSPVEVTADAGNASNGGTSQAGDASTTSSLESTGDANSDGAHGGSHDGSTGSDGSTSTTAAGSDTASGLTTDSVPSDDGDTHTACLSLPGTYAQCPIDDDDDEVDAACESGSVCLVGGKGDDPEWSVCAAGECDEDCQCPSADAGTAEPRCLQIEGYGARCVLACDGLTCPPAMKCKGDDGPARHCVWPQSG
jgi:hypothetical protein